MSDEFAVTVGWQRDGMVQVASLLTGGVTTVTGRMVDLADSMRAGPEGELSHGWHATLNRDAVNRLIRLLRKARDGAYGQDA